MIDTSNKKVVCDYTRRFTFYVPYTYGTKNNPVILTLNVKKELEKERNLRWNREFSGDKCRCTKCNPDTSNKM